MKKRVLIVLCVVAALVGVGYFCGLKGQSFFGRKKFSAASAIELTFSKNNSAGEQIAEVSEQARQEAIESVMKQIVSEQTIKRAIHDYQLESLFDSSSADLPAQLAKNIEVQHEAGGYTIKIITHAATAEQAERLNHAIIQTYQRRRVELLEKARTDLLKKYKEKIKKQEAIVEEHRAKVEAMAKKLGLPYDAPDQDSDSKKAPPSNEGSQ